MRDISLHLLDLVQNSIKAEAKLVQILFEIKEEFLIFKIIDDGRGIPKNMLESIKNPFTTSRTTRKVGLGISLLTSNAELSGGYVDIKSNLGIGTELTACFNIKSIDCLPLGDMVGTFLTLIISNPECPDFLFGIKSNDEYAEFDTRDIKKVLDGVPINEPGVINWINDTLNSELQPLFGGII